MILDPELQRVTQFDVERRKRFVGLKPDDLDRILAIKELVVRHVDEHTAAFFDFLSQFDEAQPLFSNRDLLEDARQLKREHLLAMVEGEYGSDYAEQRLKLGWIYSKIGLDIRLFLGAFHHLMGSIGTKITKHFARDPENAFKHLMSIKKIAFFDIGIITDMLIAARERTISLQQEAIRELSTPTLQVRDRLLILPIIGLIDTFRAKQLTDGLLRAIRERRAKVVVLDVTGVGTVDTKVANHLLQTVAAARLMGATAIITGLSAEVSQTLVALGVDLGRINTVGDLQGGIEEAERMLGYKIVPLSEMPKPPGSI